MNNVKTKPIPQRKAKMTKEEFMIDWVLKRASFRNDFSGVHAAVEASDTWGKIQQLKDRP